MGALGITPARPADGVRRRTSVVALVAVIVAAQIPGALLGSRIAVGAEAVISGETARADVKVNRTADIPVDVLNNSSSAWTTGTGTEVVAVLEGQAGPGIAIHSWQATGCLTSTVAVGQICHMIVTVKPGDLGVGRVDFSVAYDSGAPLSSDHIVLEANGLPTYVVDVAADTSRCDDLSGPAPTTPPGGFQCSLRGAINLANASAGRDAIGFAIPGTPPFTINPLSALPTATEGVIIDAMNTQGIHSVIVNGDGLSAGEVGLRLQGSASIVRGLVVNTFPAEGFVLEGTGGHRIEGNLIGTNFDGTRGLGFGNTVGVLVTSPDNVIGDEFHRNVISGNGQEGLVLSSGAARTVVLKNFIGTNANGSAAVENGLAGIHVGSSDNRITANVVSGNGAAGVEIGGANNVLAGNRIGTSADGTEAVGNASNGIYDFNGPNVIEGQNVISGNGGNGINISLTSVGDIVRGNLIGTNAAGSAALPNGEDGIFVYGAGNVTIGGASRNVISGNRLMGVEFAPGGIVTPFGTVSNNYIGLGSDGETVLPNLARGISIAPGASPLLDSITVSGNTIAGNPLGIMLTNLRGGHITGNAVGVTASRVGVPQTEPAIGVVFSDGVQVIGNVAQYSDMGIVVMHSSNTLIKGNDIAYNRADGVSIDGSDSQRNTIKVDAGALTANLGKAIRLDPGANADISTPAVEIVNTDDGLRISGSGVPGATVDIHADADDEGHYFLGSTIVDGEGGWSKGSAWSAVDIGPLTGAIRAGDLRVTATQTDATGNTSEFAGGLAAADRTPPPQPPPPTVSGLNSVTQTWTGTAEPSSTVKLKQNCSTTPTIIGSNPAAAVTGAYTITTNFGNGSVIADICVTATDAAGNESLPSLGFIDGGGGGSAGKAPPSGGGATVDATKPTVTIELAPGQLAIATTQPLNFLAKFSEFVYGFASVDLTGITTSPACGTLQKIVTPLDVNTGAPLPPYETSKNFNVQVSGMNANCTVTATVPADRAEDASKNTNALSTVPSGKTNVVTYTLRADTVAPIATITGSPSNPSSGSVTFAFTSNEVGSTFQCRLDIGTTVGVFAPCISPKLYTGLSGGPTSAGQAYTFNVKATDVPIPTSAGNTGVAATSTWTAKPDADDDGLLDSWEDAKFVDVLVGASTVRVDLPGADRNRKDLYVQIDWMQDATCHVQKPTYDAIKIVYEAFKNAPVTNPSGANGITLHVDLGRDSPLDYSTYTQGMSYANFTGAKWDTLSRAGSVAYVEVLGSYDAAGRYIWTRPPGVTTGTYFDDLKNRAGGFGPAAREAFFHYTLWGHQYESTGSSGLSRSISGSGGGDFMVTLGKFPPFVTCGTIQDGQGTLTDQAGSFMHELGHNLGLAHGGDDATNRKPNYVSIMNYLFQNVGLTKKDPATGAIVSGIVDYSDASRASLPQIDETRLSENSPTLGTSDYGTAWMCPFGAIRTATPITNASIDWNCNNVLDAGPASLSANINMDGKVNSDAKCIEPGPDGKLDTVPYADLLGRDDYVYGQTIRSGDNKLCDTATALGDDVKLSGTTFSSSLTPYNDWANIRLKVARIGQPGFFVGAPGQTLPEDQDLRAETTRNFDTAPIDVVPGTTGNAISGATVDVAILSSVTFQPTNVVLSSVRFGPANATMTASALSDVNGDQLSDVVLTFNVAATGLVGGTTQACVTGTTSTRAFSGCDTVNTTALTTPPFAKAGGPYVGGVGQNISFKGGTSTGTGLTFSWSFGDGSTGTGATPTHSYASAGCYQASLTVRSSNGATATSTAPVTIGPSVGPVAGPLEPVAIGTPISVSAPFADPVGRNHTANWTWDDGSSSVGTVAEANGCGTAAGTHVYTAAGVYTVTLALTGGPILPGLPQYEFVVVYDPSAGFAAGVGFFNAAAGACKLNQACQQATGPVNFGFVARNPTTGTVPLGGLRFGFRAGPFSFRSTGNDSLVISGSRAQLRGSGVVNGGGNYLFLLTVTDGSPDKIRIKVWNKSNGQVVFDNAPGTDDIAASPQQNIGGGAIVIRR